MTVKIGVGIIGCGVIARRHLNGFLSSPDLCEVRALADPYAEALKSLHQQVPAATAYVDYHDLLARDDIQVVDVLTPPAIHYSVGCDAIRAGKDLMIIKPFTTYLGHADELIALAKSKGVRLMAGQPYRFEPHYQKGVELLRAGRIGRPCRIYSRGFMRQEWLRKETNWFSNIAISGGITIENMVHQADLLAWFGGPVDTVYAVGGTFHTADWPGGGLPDDQMSILIRFQSGVIGVIEGGTAQPSGMRPTFMEVVGTEGGIIVERGSLTVGRGVKEREGYLERFEQGVADREPAMCRALLEAVRDGRPAPVPGEVGRYAVEICWAAILSSRERQPIKLPLDPAHYPRYEDKR